MSDLQEARELARERYRMDYQGILLNSLVSILSSASATAVTSFLTAVPASQLPAVATGIFVAQVLPKVIVELHKAHIRNKAIREGYSEGLLKSEALEPEDSSSRALNFFVSFCEHSSYY